MRDVLVSKNVIILFLLEFFIAKTFWNSYLCIKSTFQQIFWEHVALTYLLALQYVTKNYNGSVHV